MQLRYYVRAEMKITFNLIITLLVLLAVIIYVYGIVKYWIDFGYPPFYLEDPPDGNPTSLFGVFSSFIDEFILLLCYIISHLFFFYEFLEKFLTLRGDRADRQG